MDPYSKFLIFQLMFDSACRSLEFEVRDRMWMIINKLIHPFYNKEFHARTCLMREMDWDREETYITIEADQLATLKYELKRIKLAEKLKVVRLYWFQRTKDPKAQIIIDGKPITQDN